jgi:hypothetical protein
MLMLAGGFYLPFQDRTGQLGEEDQEVSGDPQDLHLQGAQVSHMSNEKKGVPVAGREWRARSTSIGSPTTALAPAASFKENQDV